MQQNNVPGSRSRVLVTEMVRQAKRGKLELPRFNEEGMRTVLGESKELYRELCNLMGDNQLDQLPNAVKVACQVHHATIKRNKRCALAYVDQRAEKLKQLRWEIGHPLPEDIQSNLSNSEKLFLSEYDALLTNYSAETKINVTADQSPPKDVLVQVRVLGLVEEEVNRDVAVVEGVRGDVTTRRFVGNGNGNADCSGGSRSAAA